MMRSSWMAVLWLCVFLLIGGEVAAAAEEANGGKNAASVPMNPADWRVESDQTYSQFGFSVASAGDVNGDGYDDVLVGADNYSNGLQGEGMVFLYPGSATVPALTPAWTAEGNQFLAQFGYSVSSAGDVNGDGFDDVLVGMPQANNGNFDEGRIVVFYGSAAGPATEASWQFKFAESGAHFGGSVSSAGDVNGDGYDDVIAGAVGCSHGQANEGCAFVFYGSADGLSAAPDWSDESDQYDAHFSWSVSGAGDVNGDGYDDVIVGAPSYANSQPYEGGAFVYHGSADGLSAEPDWSAFPGQDSAFFGMCVSAAGDVNGDGYDDVIVGADGYDSIYEDEGRAFVFHGSPAGLSAQADWFMDSGQSESEFGFSVSGAGDVNNDGFDDVVIGAPCFAEDQLEEGRVFVFYGASDGLSAEAAWMAEPNQVEAYFGGSVAAAGDVNGDGFDDVLVGAFAYDNDQLDEGRAYVFLGRCDDGCAYAGDCYEEGTPHPENGCLKCAGDEWAANDGAVCDDGLYCNGADSCGAGTCSVHAGDPCVAPAYCDETDDQCVDPGDDDSTGDDDDDDSAGDDDDDDDDNDGCGR